jgi:hypothetical protein
MAKNAETKALFTSIGIARGVLPSENFYCGSFVSQKSMYVS